MRAKVKFIHLSIHSPCTWKFFVHCWFLRVFWLYFSSPENCQRPNFWRGTTNTGNIVVGKIFMGLLKERVHEMKSPISQRGINLISNIAWIYVTHRAIYKMILMNKFHTIYMQIWWFVIFIVNSVLDSVNVWRESHHIVTSHPRTIFSSFLPNKYIHMYMKTLFITTFFFFIPSFPQCSNVLLLLPQLKEEAPSTKEILLRFIWSILK